MRGERAKEIASEGQRTDSISGSARASNASITAAAYSAEVIPAAATAGSNRRARADCVSAAGFTIARRAGGVLDSHGSGGQGFSGRNRERQYAHESDNLKKKHDEARGRCGRESASEWTVFFGSIGAKTFSVSALFRLFFPPSELKPVLCNKSRLH